MTKEKKKKDIDEEEHNPLDEIAEILERYEEGLQPRSEDDFEM